MIENFVGASFYPVTGLFETIIKNVYAEQERKHERTMKQLEIISNSNLRDEYAQQLLLDKFLAPMEQAQHSIQDSAKHAQYLAEVFSYHHQDHGATKEEANEICKQLRLMAIKISQIDSLHEIKTVYEAVTLFAYQISRFKHREHKYSLEKEIREGILNRLNNCIAAEANFQRRLSFMGMLHGKGNPNQLEGQISWAGGTTLSFCKP